MLKKKLKALYHYSRKPATQMYGNLSLNGISTVRSLNPIKGLRSVKSTICFVFEEKYIQHRFQIFKKEGIKIRDLLT